MKNRIVFGISIAVLMVSTGTVFGADLLIPPPPPPPPPPPIQNYSENNNCFYVRGDVGVAMYERPDVIKNLPGGVIDSALDEKLKDTFVTDIGVGCELDYNLRADVTLGYRGKSDLTGSNGLDAKFSAYTVMANVYYDIGNFNGFVPYVGVGLGVAHHKLSNVNLPTTSSSGSTTRLAYALHAGVSYDIDEQLAIDASYRYINLGKGKSGGPDAFNYSDVVGHDLRIGLRYRFED